MKSKIFTGILLLLFSCKGKPGDYSPKKYTVKVTFQDRSVDTFFVGSMGPPRLDKGEFYIYDTTGYLLYRQRTIASGVRSIKIIE